MLAGQLARGGIFVRKTLTDKGVRCTQAAAAVATPFPTRRLTGRYLPGAAEREHRHSSPSPAAPAQSRSGPRSPPPTSWTIDEARDQGARGDQARARGFAPGRGAVPTRSATVAANWLQRHVDANGSAHAPRNRTRLLNKHVLSAWADREFDSQSAAATWPPCSTDVQDHHGARQCRLRPHHHPRRSANWYAARHDDYAPARPCAACGGRAPDAQARARILDDDEIRTIWKAAEANGTFGAFVRICLMTATTARQSRGHEMGRSCRSTANRTIPKAAREKDTAWHARAAGRGSRHHPGAAAHGRASRLRFCRTRPGSVPRIQPSQGGVRRQAVRRYARVGVTRFETHGPFAYGPRQRAAGHC